MDQDELTRLYGMRNTALTFYEQGSQIIGELVDFNTGAGLPTDEIEALLRAWQTLSPEQGLPLMAALAEAGARAVRGAAQD